MNERCFLDFVKCPHQNERERLVLATLGVEFLKKEEDPRDLEKEKSK